MQNDIGDEVTGKRCDLSPLTASDLLFPLAATNLNSTIRALRKPELNTRVRLKSIDKDAKFVQKVAEQLRLPVIANERCGSWYVPPELRAGSAYFKSTDGHSGYWKFNLRRLNTEVLKIAGKAGGCIIVDSTRRGKREFLSQFASHEFRLQDIVQTKEEFNNLLHATDLSDAQTRTIPIWCAVWNTISFPNETDSHNVHVPESLVSRSEKEQINSRLSEFSASLRALNLPLNECTDCIRRPLLPVWISPALGKLVTCDNLENFTPIYLLMPSTFHDDAESERSGEYVQGAGDDAESWAEGLTPKVYWEHKDEILSDDVTDVPEYIAASMTQKHESHYESSTAVVLEPFSRLRIGDLALRLESLPSDSRLILCARKKAQNVEPLLAAFGEQSLHLECADGKQGSRDLRSYLPNLQDMMERLPAHCPLYVLEDGVPDLSVGVALVIICLYGDDDEGRISISGDQRSISKDLVRRRLAQILLTLPDAKPSRTTLNVVKAFLMSPGLSRIDIHGSSSTLS